MDARNDFDDEADSSGGASSSVGGDADTETLLSAERDDVNTDLRPIHILFPSPKACARCMEIGCEECIFRAPRREHVDHAYIRRFKIPWALVDEKKDRTYGTIFKLAWAHYSGSGGVQGNEPERQRCSPSDFHQRLTGMSLAVPLLSCMRRRQCRCTTTGGKLQSTQGDANRSVL